MRTATDAASTMSPLPRLPGCGSRCLAFPALALLLLSALAVLNGCAGTDCRTTVGDTALSPLLVSATRAHTGKIVQWGGALVEARNRQDSTELEVLAYPLDGCGRPRMQSAQVGRFLIIYPGYLEVADYPPGGRISATGRILGVRAGRIGEARYSFPLLQSYKVHQWPERRSNAKAFPPWINIGVGGGRGGVYGGIGVIF